MRALINLSLLFSLFSLFSCAHRSQKLHTIRLKPGDDVKLKLEEYVKEQKLEAVSLVTAVGSLTHYNLRFANQKETTKKAGHFEVVSLVGLLGENNSHLHMAVADDKGATVGGHLKEGNIVYTTLEITMIEDSKKKFIRVDDDKANSGSGYQELKVLKR